MPSGDPSTEAMRLAGGKPSAVRSSSSRSVYGAGRPPHQGLDDRQPGVRSDDHLAAVGPGSGQRGGGGPATQRLLGGAQVRAAEQGGGVEQEDGAVATVGGGFGAWCCDDEGGLGLDRTQDLVASRGAHRHAGERAAEFLGGPAGTDGHRAQDPVLALGAAPIGGRSAAPPAGWWAILPRAAQRPLTGRAAGQGAAPLTGQGRLVAAARDLDEHRRSGRQGLPGGVPGDRRQPGRARGGVSGDVEIPAGAGDGGRDGADDLPRRGERLRPALPDERSRFDARRKTADQRAGTGPICAEREDVPGVGVRRPGFRVNVITVVPKNAQADVAGRVRTRRPGCRRPHGPHHGATEGTGDSARPGRRPR